MSLHISFLFELVCLCNLFNQYCIFVQYYADTSYPGFGFSLQYIFKYRSSCRVIVHSHLSLSKGLRGAASGPNPSLVSGREQGIPWTHRRALTDEQCGIQYLAQGHFDMQLSPAWSRDLTIRSVVDLLYPLSYRSYIINIGGREEYVK